MKSAPTAGESRMPIGARMPAARGRAMMFFKAHQMFWIIMVVTTLGVRCPTIHK